MLINLLFDKKKTFYSFYGVLKLQTSFLHDEIHKMKNQCSVRMEKKNRIAVNDELKHTIRMCI